MARPSKLTPDTKKRIIEAIRLGCTYQLAAQYGGVAYNTFNEWMKEGELAKEGVKREFYDEVTHAEGAAAVRLLAKIEKAADEDWRAAAWKLERRYPNEYGKTVQEQRIQVTEKWRDELIAAVIAKEITTHEQIAEVCAYVESDIAEIYQRLRMQGLSLPANVSAEGAERDSGAVTITVE